MSVNNPVAQLLADHPTLILDGALATELEARGCDLSDPLWSAKVLIENPELIYQVHLDYFRAGAQCAITASYQATPQGFLRRGLDHAQSLALIAKSVQLAQRARSDYLAAQPLAAPLLVAGSVGPYGAYLADGAEYRGDYRLPQEEMMAFHRPRIAALAKAGVDLLACETLPSFSELQALLALLREFPTLGAWFAFTLRDSRHLSDGTPLAEVLAALHGNPQVLAIGLNCIALEQVAPALRQLAVEADKPLLAYPNSGEHYDAVSKTWHACGGEHGSLAERAGEWQILGARLIGGCCRTTPQDIRAIAERCRA
ncbi:homocysteine S-methyltransferase [Serratia entomophila]|uniref:homocysteine S-methyltransferase n=1 Tax=Serratia entomophila TaxID=42906 RepID=UPI0021794DB3|nr:homocysteine S-methyltransferase [Serratia entomophila]CAI0690727.1 Homocysteine S-methyltransferase [Serratia entomophila]CAI0690767.1 Homocysteine S-methyltransferase [Serratia entomophila]CAI0691467.1 Homocysteine S-methyltransferase [Serratia entomophila]CAI0888688.1 Homocysteine S-methyltransferase [Serratia entomophila]CAI1520219.1 Homocysteine S-methyltransferase [Serratia entomophila]